VVLADVPAPGPLLDLSRSGPWLPLLYMGLVPGMLAMLLYYRGLATTSASVAAFVELIFPVSAVALNTWVLKAPLQPVQLVAGAILLIAVFNLSRSASAR
jgi:drug/metabolite transporter (DMT)-like permease